MSFIVFFFKKSFWNFHLWKYVFVIRFRKRSVKSEKFQKQPFAGVPQSTYSNSSF